MKELSEIKDSGGRYVSSVGGVKLKPCPFCGHSDSLLINHMEGTIVHPAYKVECDNCGASAGYTDNDCVDDWNTRNTNKEL